MPYESFHYPVGNGQGLSLLFVQNLTFANAYCHHLWEMRSWKYLKNLDEQTININDTTYNLLARKVLNQSIEQHPTLVTDVEQDQIEKEI